MAVKMRLRREGKKKQPFYRVVVADVRSPRDGRFIEDIGYYQPLHEPSTISIDRERALYWLRNGAQPSDPVVRLLRIEGIWEEFRPGDPGKDRSEKHAQRAAAAAKKEEAARWAVEEAAKERAEAQAAAATQAAAEAEAAEAPAEAAEEPAAEEHAAEEPAAEEPAAEEPAAEEPAAEEPQASDGEEQAKEESQ
jgi:small subunit ribosomal protein S16